MRAGAGPGRWRGFDHDQWPFTMRRPPWWPENEPFPPRYRWRRGPYQLLRLLGCLFVGVFLFALLAGAVAGALFGRPGGPHPALALPFVILIVIVAVAFAGAMRRVTRPMDRLIDAARRIEAGDFSTQVPEWGSADMRSVARAFNSMSQRLKSIDEQRRSFLTDVTRELRTPLAVIRGQAEAIADGVYPADEAHLTPILDATHALERLVEDLRTLTLSDAGNLVLQREPTDIAALVHDTVDSFRSQAESARVTLSAEAPSGLPALNVDPSRIRQVIGNLVSNALRHTPAGGTVRVAVARTADAMTVAVTDDGEGIPPEMMPRIFERFVKGPGSSGSGLGLAIARDLAIAHGGGLEIENAAPHGVTARLTLPLSQSEA